MQTVKTLILMPLLKFSSLCALGTLGLAMTGCHVSLEGYEVDTGRGNGIAVIESRSLPSFSSIQVNSDVEIVLIEGSRYSARVTADENLVMDLGTEIFGNTLRIAWQGQVSPAVMPKVVVSMPRLESIVQYGNEDITIEEEGRFDNIRIENFGAGKIRFSGTAHRLTAILRGSGSIDLLGVSDQLIAKHSGSGSLLAEGLLTMDAEVQHQGSGPMTLALDRNAFAEITISGSGDVEWWGEPREVMYHFIGSGKVYENRVLMKKGLPGTSGLRKEATTAMPRRVITKETQTQALSQPRSE